MEIGQQIPPVQFKSTQGVHNNFDSFHGQWLVLYFYPKDATPGCTLESCDFRDYEKEFSFLNACILGVSRDSVASHKKFKEKQSLPFELISDTEEILCEIFDVI